MGKCQPDLHRKCFWFDVYVLNIHQAAVEELEHAGEEDVSEVSVDNLKLPKKTDVRVTGIICQSIQLNVKH